MSADMERKIYAALERQCEVVCLINNKTKTFQMIKGTDYWRKLCGETGTLYKLYRCLFTQNLSDQSAGSGKYEMFVDDRFFAKEKSQGILIIPDECGERSVRYHLIKISEDEAGFVILPYDEAVSSHKVELEKIDTIQENYLFS